MAGMNVSTLGIRVESTGITQANTDLNKLKVNADGVVVSVNKLKASALSASATLQSAFSGAGVTNSLAALNNMLHNSAANMGLLSNSSSGVTSAMNAMAASAQHMQSTIASLNSSMSGFQTQAAAVTASTNTASGAIGNAHRNGSIWNNTLKSMAVAATAYLGVNFAKSIIEQADAWGMMQAKLSVVTGSLQGAKAAQADLFVMAQKLRVPLEDTVQLYGRMTPPMMALGKTAKETLGVVEGVSMALKISGATGAEASSVMLQFSQSMNAGRLNGAEFNAVAEGAPIILRAIETELRRTGQGAELATKGLKKMASEGLITAGLMSDAINNANAKMREDFEKLPLTVDGAMTRIKNAWGAALGKMAEDTKFNEKLAQALKKIEDSLPAIAMAIGNALTFLINHGELLLKTLMAIGGAVVLAQFGALVGGIGTIITAIRAATTATASLGVALRAIGLTPLGLAFIAIGAAVAGVVTAYKSLNAESELLNKKNEEDLARAPARLAAMDAETLQLKKQVDLMRVKIGLPTLYTQDISTSSKSDLTPEQKGTIELHKAREALLSVEQRLNVWRTKNGGTFYATALNAEYKAAKALADVEEKAFSLTQKKVAEQASVTKQIGIAAEETKNYNIQREVSEKLTSKDDKEIAGLEAIIKSAKERNALSEKTVVPLSEIAKLEAKILEIRSKDKGDKKHFTVQLESLSKANVMMQEQLELQKQLAAEGAGAKISPAEKAIEKYKEENEVIKKNLALKKEKDVSGAKATIAGNEEAIASLKLTNILYEENRATQEATTLYNTKLRTSQEAVKSAQAEAENLQRLVDTFGMAKGAVEAKELADLQAIETSKKGTARTLDEIQAAHDLIEAKKQAAGLTTELGGLEEAKKAQDILDKAFNPSKVDKWANSIKGAFKGAAAALQPFAKAIDTYGAKQAHIDELREAANKKYSKGSKELAEYTEKISNKETEYRIASYGDMASAAKGFFEEGSNGYKTMEGIAQTAHAAQVAMNLIEMGQMAVKAVLNQANGDPYTAFARMAAMAAAVATLGFAVGGGFKSSSGGGAKAADVQKTQGSGTVFGDSSAKSASIENSLKMMEQYADTGLSHTSDMRKSLLSIDKAMSGLANIVIRTGGITAGGGMGITEGTVNPKGANLFGINFGTDSAFGKIMSGLAGVWGKTTQSITDAGLKVQGTLGQLQAGQGVNQYANVDTTKSSWFGLSKSTSSSVQTQGVGAELSTQFGKIFTGLEATLKVAAQGLGVSAAQVDDALKNLVIDASISLKGLSGDALAQAINSVISKAADTMASSVMSGLLEFAKVGEGAFETLVRISSEMIVTNETMTQLGHSLFTLDVAGIKASQSLIDLYGGIDKLQEVSASYYDNFYTEGEKSAKAVTAMTDALARLGVEMPTDRADFRAEVEKANRKGNYELYISLMKLSEAYAEIIPAAEDTTKSAKELADALKETNSSVQDRIDSLLEESMTLDQLRAKETAGADASTIALLNNLYALQDAKSATEALTTAQSDYASSSKAAVEAAKSVLKTAYDAQSNSIKSTITTLKALSKSINDFRAGLLVGSSTSLSKEAQLVEARNQFMSAAPEAKTGAATTYLALAKENSSSLLEYQKAFAEISNSLEDTATEADKQVLLAERQLDSLNAQVSGILTVNDSVLSVEAALTAYLQAKQAASAFSPSGAVGAGGTGVFSTTSIGVGKSFEYSAQMLADAMSGKIWSELDMGRAYMAAHPLNSYVDGSHEGGLDSVPFNGYTAKLHKNERVLTSAQASNQDALTEEIRQLRTDLQAQNLAIAQNTRESLKIWKKFDSDGLPETRVVT